jgi:CubicO group peptidase (beta-lactamase class C family)
MDRRLFIAAGACCAVSASTARLAMAQTTPRFTEAIRYSGERGGASFLVARHGVILGEHYAAGALHTRWPIGAGTRTFAPLLAASLAGDRLLNLDEPAAMTIGEWGAHPLKSTISLRALLNGTSGLGFGRRDASDLNTALALEPLDPPGVRFVADAAAYIIFAEVARRKLAATGREPDPARYLTERTLLPIGCVPIGWARAADGAPRLDDGAAVSARGWAQAGELIRREGVWRAQRLADDSVLREALRGSFAESRAGFGLWLATTARDRTAPDVDSDLWRARSPAPLDLAMAAGDGAQRLYISPSEGLVIVRQSQTLAADANWSDAHFLSLVWRDL